jgi:hypothetical protein
MVDPSREMNLVNSQPSATLKAIADRLDVLVADLVTDPRDGDRAKLIELTRGLPPGVLRKLVKDRSVARRPKK